MVTSIQGFVFGQFIKVHPHVYRLTHGRFLPGPLGSSTTVLVDQVGRKSGARRTTPLLYIEDGDDVIVIASKGGSQNHPAWWLNLREMDETTIQIGGERRRVKVRQASAEERARLWPKVVEMWSDYANYQERTDREIPLGILSPAGTS
jgi:deazaflavin-dependent oxidoreductase (nitroreductase family)